MRTTEYLPKVAVVGAGAVGCYFGAMLARSGVRVQLIGRPVHVEAIARDGLLIDRLRIHKHIPVKATTSVANRSPSFTEPCGRKLASSCATPGGSSTITVEP